MLGALGMMCLLQVLLCVLHSGVFITPIVGLCINRFTSCCAPTLSHFSAYNRPSPSFSFLPLFFTGHSTSSHFLGLFIGGLLYHSMKFFLIFLLKRQRAPMLKAVMTAVSPVARPAIGEPVAPTCSSLPDQPANRSKVCQVKTPVLQGSSSSIADCKAVNETLEGNFDESPALVECFEFENSVC